MRGGERPIHFMPWAPVDYVEDLWVKLALSRDDHAAVTFYHLFLNHSFIQGGSLPADPDLLAASLGMKAPFVRSALAYWSAPECGLIVVRDGRAMNPRVAHDVEAALASRRGQEVLGRQGGIASGKARLRQKRRGPSIEGEGGLHPKRSLPYPLPTPSPIPTKQPAATMAAAVHVPWSVEACDDWQAHLGKAPGDRIGSALKPLVAKRGWDVVRPVWRWSCEKAAASDSPEKWTPQAFVRSFDALLKRSRGEGARSVTPAAQAREDAANAMIQGGLDYARRQRMGGWPDGAGSEPPGPRPEPGHALPAGPDLPPGTRPPDE